MQEIIVKEISPTSIIVPQIDLEKAKAFFDMRNGFFFVSDGFVPYQLMAIVIDDESSDTVGYFNLVRTKGSMSYRYVVSVRYEIIGGRFIQTWRSKEKCLSVSEFTTAVSRSTVHLQEVAKLCGY